MKKASPRIKLFDKKWLSSCNVQKNALKIRLDRLSSVILTLAIEANNIGLLILFANSKCKNGLVAHKIRLVLVGVEDDRILAA